MTEFTAQLSSLDRVLLHELNHRINNEFAAVIGGVSLAAARSGNKDVKAALTAVTELLQNCAYVHRALQIPEHHKGSTWRICYVGHASFLIQTAGLNVLLDPVWSKRASPSRLYRAKAR